MKFKDNYFFKSDLKRNQRIQPFIKYEFIGHGTDIHWPDVDEDLNLRGFLEAELFQVTKPG